MQLNPETVQCAAFTFGLLAVVGWIGYGLHALVSGLFRPREERLGPKVAVYVQRGSTVGWIRGFDETGQPILTSNLHDRWLPLVREAEEPLFRLYKDGWCLYVSTWRNMRVAFARLEAERQKAAETVGKSENHG